MMSTIGLTGDTVNRGDTGWFLRWSELRLDSWLDNLLLDAEGNGRALKSSSGQQ